jgi:tryptophan synthase alpha chain
MSRIATTFAQSLRKALIAYVTVGYPSIETTLQVVPALVEGGCDIVELGIPFSDPLSDGATIQRASHHALEQGVTPQSCLEVANTLRQTVDVPLIFMSYYNPLLHYGLARFCAACRDAGVDGLIIPDLPPEEGTDLERLAQRHGLDLIYLLTPTSTEQRVRLVAARSRGFVYAVSLKGTTGARNDLPADLEAFLTRLKSVARQPVCVGFGIATAQQAQRVAAAADGVIIGSRIMEIVESSEQPALAARAYIEGIRSAISRD